MTRFLAPRRRVSDESTPPAETGQAQARQWFEAEPLWFKRAVFYEIHIRGFTTPTATARVTSAG
jgi:pullulanase/glycogen debranching enzyme